MATQPYSTSNTRIKIDGHENEWKVANEVLDQKEPNETIESLSFKPRSNIEACDNQQANG